MLIKIINPEKYTYPVMLRDISYLKSLFPFIRISIIGKSVLNKNIPALALGNGTKNLFCNASHHAREWITTPLLMKFIELYCYALKNQTDFLGYNPEKLFNDLTIWFVPMVNPDGVDLSINALSSDESFLKNLIFMNSGERDFSSWKANINGVDLNRNYDAGWDEYKALEPSLGIFGPCPAGFAGEIKESEPETKALINFTKTIKPSIVLAFHAQGEEIYYTYGKKPPYKAKQIVKELSEISGYKIVETVDISSSYGGFKDWFIKEFNLPGFTVEVGRNTTPVPIEQFEEITSRSLPLILKASEFC